MEQDHSLDESGQGFGYLDQIGPLATSAAFGGICLALFFGEVGHLVPPFLLASGLTLALLTGVRGAMLLWAAVRKARWWARAENTLLGLAAEGTMSGPKLANHEWTILGIQNECAKKTGWAPWRYVVLLAPIILFMLGHSNQSLKARVAAAEVSRDMRRQAGVSATVLAMGPPSLVQVALLLGGSKCWKWPVDPLDCKVLEGLAHSQEMRESWLGKTVRVEGHLRPNQGDHSFALVRYNTYLRANCHIPVLSKEPMIHVADGWVAITGQVDFLPNGETFRTFLRIQGKEAVTPTMAKVNPYQ